MKTIFLNRHAKSSWDNPELKDFDRPLNIRGKTDAPVMAIKFKQREKNIDLLVSSPAKRAFSTAKKFAKEFGIKKKKIQKELEIYEASIPQLLRVINRLDDTKDRIMIFGHNTTFSEIVGYLCGHNVFMATCAVVRIDFEIESWQEVSQGNGQFIYLDFPKNENDLPLYE